MVLNDECPSDMVADATARPSSQGPDVVPDDDDALLLVNTATPDNSTKIAHPDQYWDGRRETLGSWFAEFETVLSTVSPELYEFAVEFYLSDRHKTVIFNNGQAAQLDGALPRPDYDWNHPAPSDPAHYDVPHDVVLRAYRELHDERRLRDPTMLAQPP